MKSILLLFLFVLPMTGMAQDDRGATEISVSPSFMWFTESDPHGYVEVSNTGTRPAEVITDPRFGVVGTSDDGTRSGILVDGDFAPMKDLTEHITIFPPRMIIPAGATQVVRFIVRKAPLLPTGAYTSMVSFNITQRTPASQQQVGASSAGIKIQYGLVVPLVMIRGEGRTEIEVQSMDTDDENKMSLMLVNKGEFPWAGKLLVTDDATGAVYGEATAAVFTRRLIEVPVTPPLGRDLRVVFRASAAYGGAAHRRLTPPDDVVLRP